MKRKEHVLKRVILRFPLIQKMCSKIKMYGKNLKAATQVISFKIPPQALCKCLFARPSAGPLDGASHRTEPSKVRLSFQGGPDFQQE